MKDVPFVGPYGGQYWISGQFAVYADNRAGLQVVRLRAAIHGHYRLAGRYACSFCSLKPVHLETCQHSIVLGIYR